MPELPEVEMVVRGLRPEVEGRTFTSVRYEWPRQIVMPAPRTFARRLPGQRVERLWRRGKYVVFSLTGDTLLIHLKMTGRLYTSGGGSEMDDWVRVTFGLDDGHSLYFSDARKFGRLHLLPDPSPVLDRLGPEPLSDDFSAEDFAARLAARRGAIKPLLLNQTFLAGVGNIYADESLWLAQVDPRRKANTLDREDAHRLYEAIRATLSSAILYEGATIGWYRKPDGTAGESQNHFNVYDRQDQACPRCGGPINKMTLGQRGTHFCPACQQ